MPKLTKSLREDIILFGIMFLIIGSIIGGYFIYRQYYYYESEYTDEHYPTASSSTTTTTTTTTATTTLNPIAVVNTTFGTFKIEIYKNHRKIERTTSNFIQLVQDGFYNGLIFHRVIDGFVVQTGGFEPGMVERESPYPPIPLEIDPTLKHRDGAVAMARTADPDSATSQFYICDGPQPSLDGKYAVFGQVIEGMAVIRAISAVPTHEVDGYQDVPVEDIIVRSIILENFDENLATNNDDGEVYPAN